MNRLHQTLLIFSALLASWLGMQAVHESGHCLGAWATGARVEWVVLNPLKFSRTEVADNTRPLVVAWAGPVVGAAAPLLIWAVAAAVRLPGAFVLRFFAGFCLLVNGLYIAFGSFDRVGDCGEMLRHGSAVWQLWLFGLLTAPAGLWLWHRQGSHFGFGAAKGEVNRRVAYACLIVCAGLLTLGFVVGG
ncbi:MAG: hypothetical protein K8S99_16000 [Planctomycetes bacterium]|nr:hypothetical protein [Planctomycetota bacterium]